MTGEGDAPNLSVAAASDKAKAQVGLPPASDRQRLEQQGIALDAAEASVLMIKGKGDLRPLASGTLTLTAQGLEMRGDSPWSLPFDAMKVCFVDVGNQLQIRTADDLLLLRPGDQSPLLWEHFIETWRQGAQHRD